MLCTQIITIDLSSSHKGLAVLSSRQREMEFEPEQSRVHGTAANMARVWWLSLCRASCFLYMDWCACTHDNFLIGGFLKSCRISLFRVVRSSLLGLPCVVKTGHASQSIYRQPPHRQATAIPNVLLSQPGDRTSPSFSSDSLPPYRTADVAVMPVHSIISISWRRS